MYGFLKDLKENKVPPNDKNVVIDYLYDKYEFKLTTSFNIDEDKIYIEHKNDDLFYKIFISCKFKGEPTVGKECKEFFITICHDRDGDSIRKTFKCTLEDNFFILKSDPLDINSTEFIKQKIKEAKEHFIKEIEKGNKKMKEEIEKAVEERIKVCKLVQEISKIN